MISEIRREFNARFTEARYQAYVTELEQRCGTKVEFHLSETPCFFSTALIDELVGASRTMLHQLLDNPEYRTAADDVVPAEFRIPNGEPLPNFVQVDFGLLQTPERLEARLVELQAFPSLYGFQIAMAEAAIHAYELKGVTPFIHNIAREEYLALMKRIIVGGHDPAEVVLLEIDPRHQKTLPDFVVTEQLWGVRAVDVRTVVKKGNRLFYDRDGKETPIARIYNRVIPDELQHKHITLPFDYRDALDVEWGGGPDWFFRVSKFGIPWLRHPWVPSAKYLSDVKTLPADRDNYLLKPLFSFSGGGIIFAPTDEQIAAIPESERRNYILQERINFTPTVDTPHGPTKAEIRIMMVLDGHDGIRPHYRALLPLIRMGRGKMMGVDYNKGFQWVGASAGLVPAVNA